MDRNRHPYEPCGHPVTPGRIGVCLLLLAGLGGCGEPVEHFAGYGDCPPPEQPHPVVSRDLGEVRREGVLRMLTDYNSSSYFVHRGGQAGFDYELVWRFAQERDLALEVIVPEPGEELLTLLNRGEGDIICPGRPQTVHWERWARPTRPTNFVRKVVVMPADTEPPGPLETLDGMILTLPDGDPFRRELLDLRRRRALGFRVENGPAGTRSEELLNALRRGEIHAAVVDDVVAKAATVHRPGLALGESLGERRPTAWYVRENSPELLAALNQYLREHLVVAASGVTRRSRTYGIIYNRYFQDQKTVRDFRVAEHRPDKSGRLSVYDDEIRRQSEVADLDWRLVSALIYQESRFNPQARSHADARGLMQVLPRVAGAQADSLYEPTANLRAGLRIMRNSWRAYAYLDSLDQMCFTLATFHAGYGHMTDARRIAIDLGLDPNTWENSLETTLPLLAQQRYFSRTRHGYYGGDITVVYVTEILARYRAYMRLVPLRPAPPDTTPPVDPWPLAVVEPLPAAPSAP